jgi:signal transduction histidine kinase
VLVEAITNAQKHSHASSVKVGVVWSHGLLEVNVSDDGVGGAREEGGFGLEGLRDRVEALGGQLYIDSPRGRGTRVNARIPASRAAS